VPRHAAQIGKITASVQLGSADGDGFNVNDASAQSRPRCAIPLGDPIRIHVAARIAKETPDVHIGPADGNRGDCAI
jgi:hypothetical protein